ncbi:MAG: rhomboid family intramembrane serine protease [Planctomycetota bacterium]
MGSENRDYFRDEAKRWGGGGGGSLNIPMPGRRSITFWLLVINAAVFLVDGALGRLFGQVAIGPGGLAAMNPIESLGYFSADTAATGFQVWRVLTFQFLHGGLGHLIGNLLGIFCFAPIIESYLGSRRFLAFYLLCGVAGALGYLVLWGVGFVISASWVPLVGASGGVFGILAAAAVVAPNTKVLLFFVIPVPLRVLVLGVLFIAAYVVLAQGATPNANAGGEAAHLGGALLGFVLVKNAGLLNWADRVDTAAVSPAAVKGKVEAGRFERKRKQEEALEAEVDRILAKVADRGLASLTSKEKKTLNDATAAKQK